MPASCSVGSGDSYSELLIFADLDSPLDYRILSDRYIFRIRANLRDHHKTVTFQLSRRDACFGGSVKASKSPALLWLVDRSAAKTCQAWNPTTRDL